jgi:hypothetical protein
MRFYRVEAFEGIMLKRYWFTSKSAANKKILQLANDGRRPHTPQTYDIPTGKKALLDWLNEREKLTEAEPKVSTNKVGASQ